MVAQNAQERLLHLADVLEGSRRVFQQKIGKSCSYIVNVTTPSRKALRDIKAAYPQVNTDWIITGEGIDNIKTKVMISRYARYTILYMYIDCFYKY